MLRHSGKLVKDIQIEAVREALRETFPGYGELIVQRSPRAFLMNKGNQKFHFEHLSDGEKCYITLVADIARRLAMANPNAEHPLEGKGVILIDEVDLHLHPTWQSEVITRLRNTFPGCQFFITTHSPFVVSNVKTYNKEKFIPMSNGTVLEAGLKPSIMRMVESYLSSLTREEILTALSAQGFTSVIEYVCDNNKV